MLSLRILQDGLEGKHGGDRETTLSTQLPPLVLSNGMDGITTRRLSTHAPATDADRATNQLACVTNEVAAA